MYPDTALYETHRKNQVSSVNANNVDDTVEGTPKRRVYKWTCYAQESNKSLKNLFFFLFTCLRILHFDDSCRDRQRSCYEHGDNHICVSYCGHRRGVLSQPKQWVFRLSCSWEDFNPAREWVNLQSRQGDLATCSCDFIWSCCSCRAETREFWVLYQRRTVCWAYLAVNCLEDERGQSQREP